jgi:hypothetical protein
VTFRIGRATIVIIATELHTAPTYKLVTVPAFTVVHVVDTSHTVLGLPVWIGALVAAVTIIVTTSRIVIVFVVLDAIVSFLMVPAVAVAVVKIIVAAASGLRIRVLGAAVAASTKSPMNWGGIDILGTAKCQHKRERQESYVHAQIAKEYHVGSKTMLSTRPLSDCEQLEDKANANRMHP